MESVNEIFQSFNDFVELVGLKNGAFTTFFFVAHWWLYNSYKGRLDDRQKEIDRVTQDNREYRDRFLAITDDKFNYDPKNKKIKKPKGSR